MFQPSAPAEDDVYEPPTYESDEDEQAVLQLYQPHNRFTWLPVLPTTVALVTYTGAFVWYRHQFLDVMKCCPNIQMCNFFQSNALQSNCTCCFESQDLYATWIAIFTAFAFFQGIRLVSVLVFASGVCLINQRVCFAIWQCFEGSIVIYHCRFSIFDIDESVESFCRTRISKIEEFWTSKTIYNSAFGGYIYSSQYLSEF